MTHDLPPLPDYRTRGWRLVSPRAVQVLATIQARYIAHGHGHTQVSDLAELCGCGRAAVAAALGELVDLGWLAVDAERDAAGRHAGIRCTPLAPPAQLADAATLRYASRIARRKGRAAEDRARLLGELPHAVAADVARYIDAEAGWHATRAALATAAAGATADPPPDDTPPPPPPPPDDEDAPDDDPGADTIPMYTIRTTAQSGAPPGKNNQPVESMRP